jgi:assimilatory nitrate reductase catalytic subunit
MLFRGAWFEGEKLQAAIYIDCRPTLPDRAWLGKLFAGGKLSAALRASLLAGRALEGSDPGPLVCSCFGVGRNAIAACARELGAGASAAEIGKRLKCGTNCGSCVPEIQQIMAQRTGWIARA